jgi:hypothetical protein
MSCKRCASKKLKDFTAEMAIHFPGLRGLSKPHVWAFPKLLVCMDCGFVEFELLAEQLTQLKDGDAPVQWREAAQA